MKIDARKVDSKTLEYMRKRAIALRKEGKRNKEVSQILGVTSQATLRWWRNYQKEGAKALKPKKTGRPKGSNKKQIPTNKKELEHNTRKYMKSLQNNPEKVASFFQHEAVKYAAS